MDLWRKPAHLLATQVMQKTLLLYIPDSVYPFTYDHRTLKTRLPVRSALFKQRTGGLVVRWVTTSEYPLLYVFLHFHPFQDLLLSWFSIDSLSRGFRSGARSRAASSGRPLFRA